MKSSIRVIWAVLALVSLLTLAACGESQGGTSPGGTYQEGPGVTTGGDQVNCPTPVGGTTTDTGTTGGTGGTGGTAGDTGTGGTTGGTGGGTTSGGGAGGNTGDAGGNATGGAGTDGGTAGGTGSTGGTGGAGPLECPTPGTP